jgi:hypothetical protein
VKAIAIFFYGCGEVNWSLLYKLMPKYRHISLTKISHPAQAREPLKVKKSKIRVARKPDLTGPN